MNSFCTSQSLTWHFHLFSTAIAHELINHFGCLLKIIGDSTASIWMLVLSNVKVLFFRFSVTRKYRSMWNYSGRDIRPLTLIGSFISNNNCSYQSCTLVNAIKIIVVNLYKNIVFRLVASAWGRRRRGRRNLLTAPVLLSSRHPPSQSTSSPSHSRLQKLPSRW